jgi:Ca2+-binding RTX toxin-like protein
VSHQIVLAETGTYKIIINESGDNHTGVYRIALQRKFPAPPEALTLLYNEVLEDKAIDPVPDSDVYLLDGAQGDTIRLTLTDRTGGSPTPCLELFDPDGQPVENWCAGDTGVMREFLLAKDGLYTILVHEAGDNHSGFYNLALQCRFGLCETPPPRPTCGGQDATIIGTDGDNVIVGTDGDDVIVGLGGNDIIYGLDGKDRICGGNGDDTIYGGKRRDVLFGEGGNDVLRGENGPDRLVGGNGNDTLDGGNGKDKLLGGGGNDTIAGGNHDDVMEGNDGTDVCDGGDHDLGDTADDTCECIVDVEILP